MKTEETTIKFNQNGQSFRAERRTNSWAIYWEHQIHHGHDSFLLGRVATLDEAHKLVDLSISKDFPEDG